MFLEYTWKCFKITKINYFVWIIMLLKEISTKEFDKGGKGAATLLFDFPTKGLRSKRRFSVCICIGNHALASTIRD